MMLAPITQLHCGLAQYLAHSTWHTVGTQQVHPLTVHLLTPLSAGPTMSDGTCPSQWVGGGHLG